MNITVSSLLYLNSLWGIRICGVSKGAALKDDRKYELWWFAATRKGEERTLHSDLKLERNSKLIQTFKCRHTTEASKQADSQQKDPVMKWGPTQKPPEKVATSQCAELWSPVPGNRSPHPVPREHCRRGSERFAEPDEQGVGSEIASPRNIRSNIHEVSPTWRHQWTHQIVSKKVPETSALHQKLWATEQGWEQERWSSPENSAPIACPELNSQPWKRTHKWH